jgi:hypothetical protein
VTVRTLTGSAGLIAATRYTEQEPEWLITGTDAAGVQLAASHLDEAALHDRFAVAITATEAGGHAPSALADSGMRAKRASPSSVPVLASGLLALPQPSP